jgi:AcrR family transcriptional regulator
MTDAVAERGYTATPVAEVITRAGVSRKTFYVHFHDRRDCLMAAHSLVAEQTLASAAASARSSTDRNRLQATIAALCASAIEQPGGSRLQVAEIAAAGQAGLLVREQNVLELGKLLQSGLSPAASAPIDALMSTIAGGLMRVIDEQANGGKVQSPQALATELTRWTRSYYPTPRALAQVDGPFLGAEALRADRTPIGGRAPGTLSQLPRRLPDGGRGVSPSFTAHSQRERILDAVANISASRGYVALTVDDIVALAGVSLNTFYEHFKDKEDAFLVAHELGHMRGIAILGQALSSAQSWEAGVREGIGALLGFFFSEPSFARLAVVEAPIATPHTAVRMRHQLANYSRLLLSGAPRSRKPPEIADQAIAAALHEAVFGFAVRGAIHHPGKAHSHATYLVLAPFLGPRKTFSTAGN